MQTAWCIRFGLLLVVSAVAWGQCAPPYSSGYGQCRLLTLKSAQVPNTDQTNFPVLYMGNTAGTGVVADFKTTGNGGLVQNTATVGGATVPADLVFYSGASCTGLLNFEVETYDATTGSLVAWIKVASLSHTVDTKVYACYGSSSVTTWQGNVNGTWDSNFKAVYHLATLSAAVVLTDSTVTAGTQIAKNGTMGVATGEVDGGMDTTSTKWTCALTSACNTYGAIGFPITVSFWVNITAAQAVPGIAVVNANSVGTTNDGVRFNVWNPSGTLIGLQATLGGIADFNCGSVTFAQSTWGYVAFTIASGTTNNLICYGSATGGGGPLTTQTLSVTTASMVGVQNNLSIGKPVGSWLVDEVRVSTSVRAADWLNTEFNNASAPSSFYTLGAAVPNTGGSAVRHRAIVQ